MRYLVSIFLWILYCVAVSEGSYYWKDYRNKIPDDAFEAGQDINFDKVYIGQVLIKPEPHQGIYPTSIVQGKAIYVPLYGAKKADNFIQILCSNDPENLEWIQTNSTHLHLLKTNNELVRGGVEGSEWLNIGRLRYQGGTVVGKVLSGNIENAAMWFVHNENEKSAQSYELLTYNDLASKINLRSAK